MKRPASRVAATGEPLARSTRRYRPTQELRDAVLARAHTCTFTGCRTPAVACDLDHVEPYRGPDGQVADARTIDHAGTDDTRTDRTSSDQTSRHQTSTENLQPLCRHHHRAKTHAGWTVARDGPVTVWTAPTGHVYRSEPEPRAGVPREEEPDVPERDLPPPY